jgi:hypothetical protein
MLCCSGMFHAQGTLCKADGSGHFSRVFSTARIERANTASFETEVHEVIAYRLERENSGSVECSVRLSGA